MSDIVNLLLHQAGLVLPLFSLVLVGYALVAWGKWPTSITTALTRFVFSLAIPALLFHILSDLSNLPPVDARLLIAFFGGTLIVFLCCLPIARKIFRLDAIASSIFALGAIYSNNAMLGLPIARMTLGEGALPSVALILIFDALVFWSLITISVEWARHGSLSLRGISAVLGSVLKNPVIISIMVGSFVGLLRVPIPHLISQPIDMLQHTAAPMSLLTLGMGLAEYNVRDNWKMSSVIAAIKLLFTPLIVCLIALALNLPEQETQAVVLLSSMATGVSVYLMARQFNALQAPIAASLVLSALMSAITTPIFLTLMAVLKRTV